MTPPQIDEDVVGAGRAAAPRSAAAPASCGRRPGTRRRSTCTSFSIAWRAASSGVWNSGPISTSKPISAKAVAMTLAPRSWPSWPSLTTSRRGRRPSSSAKAAHLGLDARRSRRRRHRRRHRRRRCCGWSRGGGVKTFSSASEISPTVARARVASMASASRLPSPLAAACGQRVQRGARSCLRRGVARILLQARDLLLAHLRVVDIEEIDAASRPRPAGTC